MFLGKRSFLLILLVFLLLKSFSQVKSGIYHYSTAEGLSDKRILCIVKDNEGFIWVGTWLGMNRFDGHNFLTFKSNPGDNSTLKTNRIDQIVDDKNGALWVRGYDKQVYKFDKRTQQFTTLSDVLQTRVFDNLLFSNIISAADGLVWLKSEGGDIYLLYNLRSPRASYRRFSRRDKPPYNLLSNNIALSYIDKAKNVWIGTSSGLNILKREEANSYKSIYLNELKGVSLTHIAEKGKTVYLTSNDGHLILVEKTFKNAKKIKITNGSMNSIYTSPTDNKVYCTTSVGELIAISENGKAETINKSDDSSAYFSVFRDHSGDLWVESEKFGIVKINPSSGGNINYVTINSKINYKAPGKNTVYMEDKQGGVWLNIRGTGFFYYYKGRQKLERFYFDKSSDLNNIPASVTSVLYDPQGVIWLGTEGGGLKRLVIPGTQFKHSVIVPESKSPNENEVRGIYTDRQNRLWVGTKAGAVFIHDGKKLNAPLINYSANNPGVYCFLEDRKGRFWFGTKADGLFKAEPVDSKLNDKYVVTQYLPDNKNTGSINSRSIYSLFEDRRGRIWVGSYNKGLIQVDESAGKVRFKTVQNSFKKYPEGNYRRIRCIAEDIKGNIWIGTTDGLLVFNPNSGVPENYKFALYIKERNNISSLGGNDVHFIFRDSGHAMWVLTSSGGLNRAIGDNPVSKLSFKNYSTKSGLPSDFLISCTEDAQKNLWIATQNGISRYSLKNKRFQNYNASYGLSDVSFSEASCTRLQNGDIVFGTKTGILSFNPAKVSSEKVKADMVFTHLQVNSEEILPGENSLLKYDINHTDEIVLAHDQNILSIDFSVLDYRNAGREEFAVRLLGLDDTWRRNDGQTRVTYTKLPPGKYVFQVRCDNAEPYSQLPQKSLKITILPPWWKTWWAYLFYSIVVLTVLIIARRIAMTMLKLRQSVEIERRMTDLKLSFFTQVSHELRTPLSLIINPSEEILENEALSDKGSGYIQVVLKNARRMLRLVNQLLDLKKVESGKAILKVSEVEIVQLCHNIIAYFSEVIGKRNLSVAVSADVPELLAWIDLEKLDIVLYNLLANAIKFSPDKGQIHINIQSASFTDRFTIEVSDNGVGVSNEELDEIFNLYYQVNTSDATVKGTGIGLALSKELVQLHGGKIYAKPNLPKGLVVVLELKKGKGHFNLANTQFIDSSNTYEKPVLLREEPFGLSSGIADVDKTDLPLVLIVEDNDDWRSFLSTKLSGSYNVVTAIDGEDGIQKAESLLPDLILSDIMMPKMDGIQLLARLKNSDLTSHIPVVLLTAKHSVESQIRGLSYGADFYITKPFEFGLLEAAIKKFVQQRKQFFQTLAVDENLSETEATEVLITANDKIFLQKVIRIVEEKLEDPEFNVDDVADSIGMSRSAFYKKFKSLTNTAPVEFVRETRLKKAKEYFDAGEDNISTVAFAVGFNHSTYFSTCFKNRFKQSPRDYIKRRKPKYIG